VTDEGMAALECIQTLEQKLRSPRLLRT